MYSSLLTSVTSSFSPSFFSWCVVTLPKISMSWAKYSSTPHSSRSFSLWTHISINVVFVLTDVSECSLRSRYSLDPHDGVVKLRVDGLQVFQGGFLVKHALVEGQSEARVNELPMIQCLQRANHRSEVIKHIIVVQVFSSLFWWRRIETRLVIRQPLFYTHTVVLISWHTPCRICK